VPRAAATRLVPRRSRLVVIECVALTAMGALTTMMAAASTEPASPRGAAATRTPVARAWGPPPAATTVPTADPTTGASAPARPAPAATAPPVPTAAARARVDLNYPDFRGTTGLRLNGSAHIVDGRLVMGNGPNSAASAWATTRVDPARSWSTSITATMTPNADGLAFVLQAQSLSAVGSPGDGLGYGHRPGSSGPSISPSVAVEFAAGSRGSDTLGPHVGVTENGDVTHHLVARTPPASLSGGPLLITLTYDAVGHHLTAYLRPDQTLGGALANYQVAPVFEVDVDLAQFLGPGPVYAGLTGGTGSVAGAGESVTSWSYTEGPLSLDEP